MELKSITFPGLEGEYSVPQTAEDVGARPNTWMPTASDVGAAPSIHTHKASDFTSGTLSVARGGTGATTAEAALKNLGGVSMKLLWQNASFNVSAFAPQTIAIDLSGYDAILITAGTQETAITPIGDMGTLRSWSGNYICMRPFTSKASGVTFQATTVYTTYGTNAQTNTENQSWQCVPYKIYGIKGVS